DYSGAGAPNFGQIFVRDLFPVKHYVVMACKRTVGVWGPQVTKHRTSTGTAAPAWAARTGVRGAAGSTKFRGVRNVLAQRLQVGKRQRALRPVGAWHDAAIRRHPHRGTTTSRSSKPLQA